MSTAVLEKPETTETKKVKVIPLPGSEDSSETPKAVQASTPAKQRIANIKNALLANMKGEKNRENLDAFCASMGFNDFFHVRRLVNLEIVQGFVYTKKYHPAISKLNQFLSDDLAVKLEKRDRAPRTKNPINSRQALALFNGDEVEIEGSKYKLVKS